ERVEGYSNFLWTAILAALCALGLVPERAANPLSLLLTVGLWYVVARAALARVRAERSPSWFALLPLAFLASTRSVAVWSPGGLETRLFEFLVVAGVVRLLGEARAMLDGMRAGARLPGVLFAVGSLRLPDGLHWG